MECVNRSGLRHLRAAPFVAPPHGKGFEIDDLFLCQKKRSCGSRWCKNGKTTTFLYYAYLDLHNQTKAMFEGLYRTDTRDYPEEALRETLMNSLVHRDYSFSASTLVSIYDNRIEFVSVGGLPTGISLEDIMLGLSVCRNPKLAAIFYRLQLIEAYGTGMPKIIGAYAGTGLEPKIEVTNNAFKITLPNRNAARKVDTVSNAGKSNEDMILNLIAQNGHVVRSDVDQLLDVSQTTASRILKRMVAEGLIYQDGRGRKTKYKKR